MSAFEKYFNSLQGHALDEITEHSHRNSLQQLLEAFAPSKIKILHEPKREGKFGSPDFKITSTESIVGYVENKKIEDNLDKTLKTEQLKKYQALSDNILLTNYIEWVWIKDGKVNKREVLCFKSDIENKKAKLDPAKITVVEQLVKQFFSQAPKQIGDAKKLAEALAVRARLLKDFLHEELTRQEKEHTEGRLYQLYETFKKFVFHELTVNEFSDAFAQNLVYGLFLSKLNADTKKIDLNNAWDYIPSTFELIRELVDFLKELKRDEYRETKWIVEEILTILNNLDLRSIQDSLSFVSRKKRKDGDEWMGDKDPYVYFYEDFLKAYDKKLRKAKGVYYTPPAVVNFIVRAIDDILVNTFGIKDGLADRNKVTVLDFATGTGTFLVEVLQQIFDKLPKGSGKKELYIKEHILKNIYGFEYLIAPYTIAHLKLSQFLKDNDYELKEKDRLQIFLTNTLEPIDVQEKIPFLPALTEESKNAQKVKDQPILVITGNPPYSGHSKNPSEVKVNLKKGQQYPKKYRWNSTTKKIEPVFATAKKDGVYKIKTFIGEKLMDYFFVDGKPLGEKNPKWLQDDYVKFIRFAQDKMDKLEEGIVGIITNHRFLTNPTFRGMRQSLMRTFHQIYVIDLHGSNKPKESTPEGEKDENVFDIEQGVAISVFIKKKGLEKKIFHTDFWGTREGKYKRSLEDDIKNIHWHAFQASMPFYLLSPQTENVKKEYEKSWLIKEIFKLNSNGIVTKRDGLVIDFSPEALKKKLNLFNDPKKNDNEIANFFNLPLEDKDKWNLNRARAYLYKTGVEDKKLIQILYRPFDVRWIYFDEVLVARLVRNLIFHLQEQNHAIVCGRAGLNVLGLDWNLTTISKFPTDLNLFSRGGGTIFPLFILRNGTEAIFFEGQANESEPLYSKEGKPYYKEENFTKEFRDFINALYQQVFLPEEILGYLYGILYSPSYRKKYAEFLKIDFPRIPFTPDKKIFQQLSVLGNELIQAHLMEGEVPDYPCGVYLGKGNNIVEKPRFVSEKGKGKLFINQTQYFDDVPADVYNFYIGGYPVLDKYLKDRKGRDILHESEHIERIIKTLAFTIDQMKKIDELTKSWI